MKTLQILVLALAIMQAVKVTAQNTDKTNSTKNFYLKPYFGFIGLQDMSLSLSQNNLNTVVEVKTGFGYTTGISFGYNFSKNISAELGWEYKRNQATITVANIETDGDYASNFIYLNGFYKFSTQSNFKPYFGLGLSLIEEIDLDIGDANGTSFSDSGNLGFQGIVGLDYNFSKRWAMNLETKYVVFQDFNMQNETTNATLNGLKYNPLIVNIGIKYRF